MEIKAGDLLGAGAQLVDQNGIDELFHERCENSRLKVFDDGAEVDGLENTCLYPAGVRRKTAFQGEDERDEVQSALENGVSHAAFSQSSARSRIYAVAATYTIKHDR